MTTRIANTRPNTMRRRLTRHGLPLAILIACALLLARRLEGLDTDALTRAFAGVTMLQWIGAAIATGLSFLAVARYDVIAHRHFATGCDPARATLAGATAIALGQTLGAGAVVGAFVRWRMIPGLGLTMAARMSAFVAISFLAALLVVLALAGLCLPHSPLPGWASLMILTGALLLALAAFRLPSLQIGRFRFALPSLRAMWALFLLCLLDTVMAGLALHLLLPEAATLPFTLFLPAFLLALGIAILSGTPGGVGPFELTLLTLLPHAAQADLLAAILAFRIVYYAIPAVIAGLLLLRGHAKPANAPPEPTSAPITPARAELGVLRQNGGAFAPVGKGICGLVPTGQTLTALFDPCGAHAGDTALALRTLARDRNRFACKYKITARHAAHARRAGWAILHVADEAMIDTRAHNLQGATYRQLRRKLRHAGDAGLRIERAKHLPLCDMAEVSAEWDSAHGGARGFSMGRFDPAYLQDQIVFLAYKQDRLLAFISLHRAAHEWCLDLMRSRSDCPDGTMHALVHEAINAARARGINTLSLAAVPARAEGKTFIKARLRRLADCAAGGAGLRQFKASFAPHWQPLYMAAPSPTQLAIAACDLALTIRAPGPTSPAGKLSPHNDYEEKPVAPAIST